MKVKMKLDPARVLRFVNENGGKIFSVKFIKKDGSIREMVCRTGVKKNTVGGSLAFDPIERNLLPVFDLNAAKKEGDKGYRMISLDKIIEITIAGDTIVNKEKIS